LADRYDVRAEPEVSADLADLAEVDSRLVDRAIELMSQLRDDPWLGEDLWERYNMQPIKDCRKLRFDVPDWKDKPRFRIVYRNEPLDGAPGLVRIWSVGPRTDMVAYARATARISREAARSRRRR
jgi:Txe/YoeB family toxin of Txe-Axe toxin-antitoxin module